MASEEQHTCSVSGSPYMEKSAWLKAFCMCAVQGTLVNETRCLECETVTSREEAFYDLSLEIEQNCSLTACLRNFRYPSLLHICCPQFLRHSRVRIALKSSTYVISQMTFAFSWKIERLSKLTAVPWRRWMRTTSSSATSATACRMRRSG